MSFGLALRCFFRTLRDKEFAARVQAALAPPAAAEPPPAVVEPPPPKATPESEALRLLAALQRDGRLLDFLNEDIAGYDDGQVGAAVRGIHRDCRKTLEKYVELVPVLDEPEGGSVAVPAGFDPAAIRLTGNVKGSPPFRGTLAHRGWRAAKVALPAEVGPAGVLQAAEVELP